MQPCVLKCTSLQRVASRGLSGSQTLYTTAPNKPTHLCMACNPCIPAHITENHLNPRASKDPKSLVYIWYSKSAQKRAVRKGKLEIGDGGCLSHPGPRAQTRGSQQGALVPTVVPVKRTHRTQATLPPLVLLFSVSTFFLTQRFNLTQREDNGRGSSRMKLSWGELWNRTTREHGCQTPVPQLSQLRNPRVIKPLEKFSSGLERPRNGSVSPSVQWSQKGHKGQGKL